MTDLEDLWPNVESAAPDNPGPLLVVAGWCEENDEPSLAYALKWCAGHQKRPWKRSTVRRPWRWIRQQSRYVKLSKKAVERLSYAIIPTAIFDQDDDYPNACFINFSGSVDAYRELSLWLIKARRDVEIPTIVIPPQPEIVKLDPLTCAMCGIMRSRDVVTCPVCRSDEVKK